jgi:hypothetical protein
MLSSECELQADLQLAPHSQADLAEDVNLEDAEDAHHEQYKISQIRVLGRHKP